MNEIAAFREGGTINRWSWHRADQELGGEDDHSRYHNVYGLLMTQATKTGMLLGIVQSIQYGIVIEPILICY